MEKLTNNSPKFDIYQTVTDKILSHLENGVVPWVRPWDKPKLRSMPQNAYYNTFYRGINIMLLTMSMWENGFNQNKWLTYKNALDLGGSVKKGEKSSLAILYRPVEKEKLKDGAPVFDDEGNPILEKYSIIKGHHLFNIEQTEGLEHLFDKIEPSIYDEKQLMQEVNQKVKQMVLGAKVSLKAYAQTKAYYQPSVDTIFMPKFSQFKSEEDYYATLLHELSHATGHKSRLNREGICENDGFGKPKYAFEELVAELASAFLCYGLGIDMISQHAAYIDSWIKALKDDKKVIFKATGKARLASEFLTSKLLNTTEVITAQTSS